MIWTLLAQLVIYSCLIAAMAAIQPAAVQQSPFSPWGLFVFLWIIVYWPSVVAVGMLRYAGRAGPFSALRIMIVNEALLLLLAQISLFLSSDWPYYIALLVEISAIHMVIATTRTK